jgi:hypothetical protein
MGSISCDCHGIALQELETSKGQQEEVLAYIEKKKKKKGMVRPLLSLGFPAIGSVSLSS